ncbi:MAG: hypothetical protein AAGN15_12860 [Cyanobacteria bacterium J06581_3]
MQIVIIVNCLMAVTICMGTVRLWQWRQKLQRLTIWLSRDGMASRQLEFALMQQRAQLTGARLELVRLQLRSRQVKQLFRLVQILRLLLFYILRLRRPSSRRPRR